MAADEALDYLSVTLSHPRWLAARWLTRFGFEAAERWCRFDNAHAPATLLANTLRGSRDDLARRLDANGVATEPTRFSPHGLRVVSGRPLRTPLAAEGWFLIQDEASQLVALLVGARPGHLVLDACAAPGGKTVAICGEMQDEGLIAAADLRPKRMRLLRRTVAASLAHRIRLVRADLERAAPFGAGFDRVLVDAPCSGLGTIRRDPDVKWRRIESDLGACAARQRRLLDEASRTVRPGGRLVYATCSSEPEENDEVVRHFLDSHPAFALVHPRDEDAATPLAPVIDAGGFLRTLPFAHGLEAFFGALLERHPE